MAVKKEANTMVSVSTVQPSINIGFLCTYKDLKGLCTLYLKNSNLQILIHEKLCKKLQLTDEKTHVHPWSHSRFIVGWTVLTETIVLWLKLKQICLLQNFPKLKKL